MVFERSGLSEARRFALAAPFSIAAALIRSRAETGEIEGLTAELRAMLESCRVHCPVSQAQQIKN